MEKTILKVEGMSCGHCKNAVEKALKSKNGVSDAEVDLSLKVVSVVYDPGKINRGDLAKAVTGVGFKVVE